MNDALTPRLAALSGLALAAAAAVWWLGSTRLALDDGADASRSAAYALQALWLARALPLALQGVRVGALSGWRPAAATGLGWVAPSWPVLVLAWSASALPLAHAVLAELALLAASLVLPLVGRGLRLALRQPAFAEVAATTLGSALAAAVWFARGVWAPALA